MKIRIVKTIIYAAVAVAISVLSVLCNQKQKRIDTLDFQVEKQAVIIDSLLRKKETVFNVQLMVEDNSKSKVQGKKNSGTINVPQSKEYTLIIKDSTNLIKK